jgi:hypothetical protein
MEPNFEELTLRGRLILSDVRAAEDAEARPASAMQVTPTRAGRHGMLQDEAYCEALGHAFRSARTTPSRAGRQSQSEIDASWGTVIAELNLGASHARPASQEADNFGWGSIVEKVQAEVKQTNFATTTSPSATDASWAEVIAKAKAERGLR